MGFFLMLLLGAEAAKQPTRGQSLVDVTKKLMVVGANGDAKPAGPIRTGQAKLAKAQEKVVEKKEDAAAITADQRRGESFYGWVELHLGPFPELRKVSGEKLTQSDEPL